MLTFGQLFRKLRKERNLTQQALASAAGAATATVHRLEHDHPVNCGTAASLLQVMEHLGGPVSPLEREQFVRLGGIKNAALEGTDRTVVLGPERHRRMVRFGRHKVYATPTSRERVAEYSGQLRTLIAHLWHARRRNQGDARRYFIACATGELIRDVIHRARAVDAALANWPQEEA